VRRFRFRISVKITIGYVALLLFLAGALLIVSWTIDRLQREIEAVTSRDLKVQELTYQIDKNASDMENNQRGYLIAGGEDYLKAYEGALDKWKMNGGQLRGYLEGSDEQTSRLASVENAIEQWISLADRQIKEARPGAQSAEELEKLFSADSGRKQMEGMREQLSRLRQAEKVAMDERVKALRDSNGRLRGLLYGVFAALTACTILFSWIVSRHVTRNIRKVTEAVSDIAKSGGDLTKRIEVKTTDETLELSRETNALLASLQSMIGRIQEQARGLSEVSGTIGIGAEGAIRINGQVNDAIRRVAEGAEQQVAQTEEITAIMAEAMKGLEQAAADSREVGDLALATREAADDGGRHLDKTGEEIGRIEGIFGRIRESVQELSEQSGRIQEIAGYISEVSTQTNLLALNAAIEAARAGVHGRGFAVVSAEIRKLADQTAHSARQISLTLGSLNDGVGHIAELIESSSEAVYGGTSSMREAGDSVRRVVDSVSRLTGQMLEVAASVERIASGSGQVVSASEEIGRVTEETSAFAEQMTAMAEEQNAALRQFAVTSERLGRVSDALREVAGNFRV